MKNKKSMLTLGILALVLILGVGYAVVSNVGLSISGTASVGESELKVSFEGTVTPDSDKVTGTAVKGGKTGTISVTGLTLNEVVSIDYTIQNEETDVDANVIKANIINDKAEFFEVTTDTDTTAKSIAAGATGTVKVNVKLIKTPVNKDDSTANITVNLTASAK